MRNQNWSREELIVAFNLYCKTPFTKINASNKGVKELAQIIGRSTSAVALKLANFARLDPALQSRNISGMSHGSKGEAEIWNEFNGRWEELAFESEKTLASYIGKPVETVAKIKTDDLPREGKEREAIVKIRVNQSFFRDTILASYDNHCCITGISIPALLTASHIIPWSKNKEQRMNPANGLCLNALHDRAFDKGLVTITPDYKFRLSKKIQEKKFTKTLADFFFNFHEKPIVLPQKFLPEKSFLEYHYENIFCK